MKKSIIISVLLIFLFSDFENRTIQFEIDLKPSKSEFGIEDLAGRLAYEQLITANPATGEVPAGIRVQELAFARSVDTQLTRARTHALTITSAGPSNVGGRTRALALDVRDENVIIAGGVSGGLWKSTDGGSSWQRKSDPENRSGVTSLAQDTRPGKEDTWYYGTGEIIGNSARGGGAPFRGNGIYKSVDNGETWNPLPSTIDSEPSAFNSQFQYIWGIEINDKNLLQDELIVAVYGGILRSLDGGITWELKVGLKLFGLDPSINLNDTSASFFTSLEKTSDGVFYASLSTSTGTDATSAEAGIYTSQNGNDWFEFSPFTSESRYRRIVIGSAPSAPNKVYFLIDSNPTFLLKYDLSSFSGVQPVGTWTDLSNNVPSFGGQLGDFDSQSSFNMLIKVHPTDEDIVYIGGTNLYRSTDGFATSGTTEWIGGYNPEGGTSVYPNHHPDQHNLVFFPSNPNKMLSASDGGLIESQNARFDSVMWTSRNSGYLTSQFFTVALSKEENDDFILGGMQDNGTDISSGGQNWSHILGGDGGYVATTPDKKLWFASFQNGQTFRLTLSDEFKFTSFARVDPDGLVTAEGSSYLFINPFILDPKRPNRMFIAGGSHLYVNDNVSQIPGGSQIGATTGWEQVVNSKIEFGRISSIDISTDGEVVYFGSSNGILNKIENASQSEVSASVITASIFPEDAYLSSISVNPEDPDHLVVCFSNYEVPSIFESTDGGATFTDISGNLEQFSDGSGNGSSVRWVELVPSNTGIHYLAGTSVGLYSTEFTNASATSWMRESSETVGSSIITMMDYRSVDGRLAIASHGNGVFTTTVSDFKRLQVQREGEDFQLLAAYPNPFNVTTKIQYTIPEDGTVRVNLYSAKGEFVNNLLWAPQFAGENTITWDGRNSSGTALANGVYLYTVQYGATTKTGRVLLRR